MRVYVFISVSTGLGILMLRTIKKMPPYKLEKAHMYTTLTFQLNLDQPILTQSKF
jgi:hypothetical protein